MTNHGKWGELEDYPDYIKHGQFIRDATETESTSVLFMLRGSQLMQVNKSPKGTVFPFEDCVLVSHGMGKLAKWYEEDLKTTKAGNMCDCNDREDRTILSEKIGDIITVTWDEYADRLVITSGDYQKYSFTDTEALKIARTITRVIENAKKKEIEEMCRN